MNTTTVTPKDTERFNRWIQRYAPRALAPLRALAAMCAVSTIVVVVLLTSLTAGYLAVQAAVGHGLEGKTADILGDGINDVIEQLLPSFLALVLGYAAFAITHSILEQKIRAGSAVPIFGGDKPGSAFHGEWRTGKTGLPGASDPTPVDAKGESRD
jgi:hypothetical protein